MKKTFVLLALVFLVTGCSLTEKQDLEKVVDNVIASNENFTNKSFSGYEYYLPRGVTLTNRLGYNSTLKYKSNKIYLYVDVVSYYHKIEKEYTEVEGIYFSKKLNYDNKKGYINIVKINNDEYYMTIEYNYGKIEAYSNEADLNGVVINSLNILKTIKFNDIIIESLIGENQIEYKEEKFNLFGSEPANDSYLDIIDDQKKDETNKDKTLVDEDKIIIETEEEITN